VDLNYSQQSVFLVCVEKIGKEEGYCNRVWRLLCVGALPVGVLPFLLGWMGGGLATRGYAQLKGWRGDETKVASAPKKGSSANCETRNSQRSEKGGR